MSDRKCKVNPFEVDVNYTMEVPLSMRTDEPDANTTYQGWAKIGSSPKDKVWRIRKITVSGNETIITWANGNSNFENQWDQRAITTYV